MLSSRVGHFLQASKRMARPRFLRWSIVRITEAAPGRDADTGYRQSPKGPREHEHHEGLVASPIPSPESHAWQVPFASSTPVVPRYAVIRRTSSAQPAFLPA